MKQKLNPFCPVCHQKAVKLSEIAIECAWIDKTVYRAKCNNPECDGYSTMNRNDPESATKAHNANVERLVSLIKQYALNKACADSLDL